MMVVFMDDSARRLDGALRGRSGAARARYRTARVLSSGGGIETTKPMDHTCHMSGRFS
jgi:hypothetical protein